MAASGRSILQQVTITGEARRDILYCRPGPRAQQSKRLAEATGPEWIDGIHFFMQSMGLAGGAEMQRLGFISQAMPPAGLRRLDERP